MVANRLGPTGLLVCIDRDPAAEERFEELAAEVPCQTRFLRMDYADALPVLAEEGIAADMVYLDLGVSSMQIDAWERGFSYSYDAPLDMRMDPTQELDARAVVNEWDERRLAGAFKSYGEERYAGAIARAIVKRRESAPFETTGELAETIKSAVPAPARFGGGHPAKRVFQAIRIVVNDELGSLDRALPAAWELLRPGGRMAALSFHSLEDRRVKHYFAERVRGCICPPDLPVCACGRTPEAELVTRRAVMPSASEVAENPRAGSGRLRAARKLEEDS
jgi:16S rRNA (cytosine1402-N4)-methyltransferase